MYFDYFNDINVFQIRFHNSTESLFKHIPLDILPEDYGGKEKCLDDLEGKM